MSDYDSNDAIPFTEDTFMKVYRRTLADAPPLFPPFLITPVVSSPISIRGCVPLIPSSLFSNPSSSLF